MHLKLGSWTLMLTLALALPAGAEEPDDLPLASPGHLQFREEVPIPPTHDTAPWSKPIDQIQLDVFPEELEVPQDRSQELFTSAQPATAHVRGWNACDFYWAAPELAHQPLYFDDVPLERYGQTISPVLQPFISGTRFFATVPALPYKMGLNPPYEPVYTLGYYRPGSPAPCVRQRLPWEMDAAALEAGAVVMLIFLLP